MRSTEGFGAGFRDTNRALFASQSGLRLSQSMCSQATQESFDFCTPVDQPVERTAVVPESPSPAKKRTRRALAGGSQVEELAQEFHDTGARRDPPARARGRRDGRDAKVEVRVTDLTRSLRRRRHAVPAIPDPVAPDT